MAEIEYGGIKIGGSKLLLIVPLLGTIIGGLWGGFELYSRYLDMEEKIQTYVAPDLSGFDKRLELVKTEVEMIEKEMKMVLEEITLVADVAKEMKNDLRGDVRRIEKIVEDTEARVKDDSREFRDDMKDLEERVELKINKALNNPLNKVISR
jgi:gas vesicle protein